MKRLIKLDWDAIAGILAAVIALVLHFLHIIEADVLLMLTLVLISLLFVRDLRREQQQDELQEVSDRIDARVKQVVSTMEPPDTILIGPDKLREESRSFSENAAGDMVWFNVCLKMFHTQPLFDVLLGSALTNSAVNSVRFVLDESERESWESEVIPRAEKTGSAKKLEDPLFADLNENVSFVLSGQSQSEGKEALLSFWGEPFMASHGGSDVPRYMFYVREGSDLIEHFVEMDRKHRFSS